MRITPILDEKVCMKCLKNHATHKYFVKARGYGSRFDSMDTHFQLCDDCDKSEYAEWANETSCYKEDGCVVNYVHEESLCNFIESLPLASQELFYNRFCKGNTYIDSQDWLDIFAEDEYEDKEKYDEKQAEPLVFKEVEYLKEKTRLQNLIAHATSALKLLEDDKENYFKVFK